MAINSSAGKINLGLARITNFFEHTLPSDPRAKLRIVHVAGTNGKGSVCALISEALAAAGYKTGTFNSPHFLTPNDAVRIQGVPIPNPEYADLREWISSLDAKSPSPEGPLSLFEQTTAAALWWFAKNDVDIAVIEVGLGGLRDATNVFGTMDGQGQSLGVGQSLVQCICPVDEDHLGMIGNNVEEIAREKAGIMRSGSWIVVGSQGRTEAFHTIRQIAHTVSPKRILNVCRQPTYDLYVSNFSIKTNGTDAELPSLYIRSPADLPMWAKPSGSGKRCLRVKYPATLDSYVQNTEKNSPEQSSSESTTSSDICTPPTSVELDLPLVLPGYYQAENASVAFYALDILRAQYRFDKLTDAAIQVGFQNVRWPGRLSWLCLSQATPTDPQGTAGADTTVSCKTSDEQPKASGDSSDSSGGSDGSDPRSHSDMDPLNSWILADGAHNEPAAAELRKYVDATLRRAAQQRHIHADDGCGYTDALHVRWIVGFTKGKDIQAILNKLVRPGDAIWAVPFSRPDEMPWIQCIDPSAIEGAAKTIPGVRNAEFRKFGSLDKALHCMPAQNPNSHLNVLCGSLYLVADLYRELGIRPFGDR